MSPKSAPESEADVTDVSGAVDEDEDDVFAPFTDVESEFLRFMQVMASKTSSDIPPVGRATASASVVSCIAAGARGAGVKRCKEEISDHQSSPSRPMISEHIQYDAECSIAAYVHWVRQKGAEHTQCEK